MRADQVVVGVGPVSPGDVLRVARDGAGVRLGADALAALAALARAVRALA